jgi:hypothetical protein
MSQMPNSPSSSRPLPRIPVQVEEPEDYAIDVVLDLNRGGEERRGKSGKKGRNLRLRRKHRHQDLRGKKLPRGMFCSGKNFLKLMTKIWFFVILTLVAGKGSEGLMDQLLE